MSICSNQPSYAIQAQRHECPWFPCQVQPCKRWGTSVEYHSFQDWGQSRNVPSVGASSFPSHALSFGLSISFCAISICPSLSEHQHWRSILHLIFCQCIQASIPSRTWNLHEWPLCPTHARSQAPSPLDWYPWNSALLHPSQPSRIGVYEMTWRCSVRVATLRVSLNCWTSLKPSGDLICNSSICFHQCDPPIPDCLGWGWKPPQPDDGHIWASSSM